MILGGFLGLFTAHRLRLILMSQCVRLPYNGNRCLLSYTYILISRKLHNLWLYNLCRIFDKTYVNYSNSARVIERSLLINEKKKDLIQYINLKKMKISLNIIIKC